MRARPVRLLRRLPSRLPGRSAVALGALGAVLLAGHLVAAPADGASSLPASGMLEASDAAVPDPLRVGDDLVLAAAFRPVLTSVTAARLAASARSRPGATPAARPAAAPAAARSAQAARPARSGSGPRPFYARLPVLRVGSTGTWVAAVQRKLGVSRTGYFGPLTRSAVIRFQAAHGLPRVGQVGPLTWKALLAARAPSATRTAATRTAPRPAAPASPVVAGRICPAPGAAFGQGWGAARAGHSHQGQDLMGQRGSPILAIEDAVVIREGRQSNGALRIVLQGVSGSKFYYGHMDTDLVHAGAHVRRGQVIGLMGDTGSPGAVHLHFEYWASGGESAAVDPAPLLRRLC